MKKIICLTVAIALCFTIMGCGAEDKIINGKKYGTYGLLNQDDKDPNIRYTWSGWSVAWGCIFFYSIAAPVYFFGFDLYEPVELKTAETSK